MRDTNLATITRRLLPAGIASMLLAVSVLFLLGPGGRDDVYKTLWAAEHFSRTGCIENYNGDPVEQSSSLLHVLVLGGLKALVPLDIADLNFILVLATGVAGIWLAPWLMGEATPHLRWMAAIGLGLFGPWAYWSAGGLDAVLSGVAWLLFLGAARSWLTGGRRWPVVPAVAVLALVRPENSLVALLGLAGLAAYLQWQKKELGHHRRPTSLLLLCVAAALALLAAWRLWHGGSWLPQSAAAKSGLPTLEKGIAGLRYLWHESRRHPELIVAWLGIGAGIVQVWRKRPAATQALLLFTLVSGMLFVVVTGGDWMENGRFLVPFLPLGWVVVGKVVADLPRLPQIVLAIALPLASLAGLMWIASSHNIGYPLLSRPDTAQPGPDLPFSVRNNKVHLRDAWPLEMLLEAHDRVAAAKGGRVEVLSQQAGYLPYHLAMLRPGGFHFVDLVALSTPDFTDCALTRSRGNYQGGLNMDLVFLLDHLQALEQACGFEAPDIIFSLDGDDGMLAKAVEARGYRLVALQTGTMPRASGCFPGLEVSAREFIAVKAKWHEGAPPVVRDAGGLY